VSAQIFVPLLILVASSEAQNAPLTGYMTVDDYPSESFKNNEEGQVVFELKIGKDGLPKNCRIVQSSGFERLDNRTCEIMMKRARFQPARLSNGEPAEDYYTNKVTWRIER
jgi:protein TonB